MRKATQLILALIVVSVFAGCSISTMVPPVGSDATDMAVVAFWLSKIYFVLSIYAIAAVIIGFLTLIGRCVTGFKD